MIHITIMVPFFRCLDLNCITISIPVGPIPQSELLYMIHDTLTDLLLDV